MWSAIFDRQPFGGDQGIWSVSLWAFPSPTPPGSLFCRVLSPPPAATVDECGKMAAVALAGAVRAAAGEWATARCFHRPGTGAWTAGKQQDWRPGGYPGLPGGRRGRQPRSGPHSSPCLAEDRREGRRRREAGPTPRAPANVPTQRLGPAAQAFRPGELRFLCTWAASAACQGDWLCL